MLTAEGVCEEVGEWFGGLDRAPPGGDRIVDTGVADRRRGREGRRLVLWASVWLRVLHSSCGNGPQELVWSFNMTHLGRTEPGGEACAPHRGGASAQYSAVCHVEQPLEGPLGRKNVHVGMVSVTMRYVRCC